MMLTFVWSCSPHDVNFCEVLFSQRHYFLVTTTQSCSVYCLHRIPSLHFWYPASKDPPSTPSPNTVLHQPITLGEPSDIRTTSPTTFHLTEQPTGRRLSFLGPFLSGTSSLKRWPQHPPWFLWDQGLRGDRSTHPGSFETRVCSFLNHLSTKSG